MQEKSLGDQMKSLDRIANLSIIVAVIVFLFVVGRRELYPRLNHVQRLPEIDQLIGKSMQISGVRFPRQQESLLLALSTSCRYCQASTPFYRELSKKVRGKVDLIAITPQTQEQMQLWLASDNVVVDQIVSARLDALGIITTPSLLLLDKSGKVTQAWIGSLDEQGQKQVMARIVH